jgi:hypothetical protein
MAIVTSILLFAARVRAISTFLSLPGAGRSAGKFQFSGMCDSGYERGRIMKRSKFSEAQIPSLRQGEEGTAVGEICRKAGSGGKLKF